MKSEKSSNQLQFLALSLREMLDPKNPLYRLSETIDWTEIEAELSPLYADFGRPAKSIRLMVGLNLMKHIFNLGKRASYQGLGGKPLLLNLYRGNRVLMEAGILGIETIGYIINN